MSANAVYIVTVSLLIALAGLGFWIARQSLGLGSMNFFQNRQRRLGLVESAALDGRRRLLLVRRDNVQHLILTGGPVDVVVETGIQAPVQILNGYADAYAEPGNQRQRDDPADYSADTIPLIIQSEQRN